MLVVWFLLLFIEIKDWIVCLFTVILLRFILSGVIVGLFPHLGVGKVKYRKYTMPMWGNLLGGILMNKRKKDNRK
jgi:hypothetical protein